MHKDRPEPALPKENSPTAVRVWQFLISAIGIAGVVVPILDRDVATLVVGTVLAVGSAAFWVLRYAGARSGSVFRMLVRRRYDSGKRTQAVASALLSVSGSSLQQQLWEADASLAFNDEDDQGNVRRPEQPLLAPMQTIVSRERRLLLARRDLVGRNRSWKRWAFAIRIVTNGVTVAPGTGRRKGRRVIRFHLDESALGIYSNQGKRYLHYKYAKDRDKHGRKLTDAAHSALYEFEHEQELPIAEGFPLRWSSAGALPVVQWKGQQWVVLFHRDIFPEGWNVANGASETEREQVDIAQLAHREFCEEVLVVSGETSHGSTVVARPFKFGGSPHPLSESQSFSALHRKLREKDGELRILTGDSAQDRIDVDILKTPWDIEVAMGGRIWHTDRVIPSINPTDHGIEFIKVVTFDLDDEDVILDGEIGADGSTLIRRAVGLFSVEALRRINDGTYSSQGKPPRDEEDRVLLPPLDPGDFHVFNHDIAWRRSKSHRPDGVEAEWLDKFDAALKDPHLGEATRKLCPVTWKTIEAALKQRLI